MLDTVKVPEQFRPIFEKAQEYVAKYFKEKKWEPEKGTIEIFGERYILVRAASMSVDFFQTIKELYKDRGEEEARDIARNLLFDIAHAIGRSDARNFHKKMNLKDPIEKLSAGPVHFSHSGWAFVDIFPESNPTPDENYYLIYDHPFSFESDAWEGSGKRSDFPVCVMNAGYSSGWCEESFGIPLVATEIMCKANGDEACRFIMAHPSKIEQYIRKYIREGPSPAKKITKYEIPGFFKRKQIEDELRERERFFQGTLNDMVTFVAVLKPDGEIIFVNNTPLKVAGMNLTDVVGKKFYDASWWGYSEEAKKNVKEDIGTAASGKMVNRQIQVQTTGGLIWIEFSIHPIYGEDGKIKYLIPEGRDITKAKKAEDELNILKQQIEYILGAAKTGLDIIDSQFNLVYVDPEWAKVYGDPAGKKCYEYFMGRTSVCPDCGIMKALETKKPVISEEFLLKENNRPVQVTTIPFQNEKGEWLVAEVNVDITERKKMEDMLREDEERMRAIFENSTDGILISNSESKKFYLANEMICKMLGYSHEEIKGLSVMDIHPPENLLDVMEVFEKQLKGEMQLAKDIPVKRKDGSLFYADINAFKVVFGGKAYLCGFFRDVTEHKTAEAQEKKRMYELEKFNKIAIGRELKMIELKDRVKELEEELRKKE